MKYLLVVVSMCVLVIQMADAGQTDGVIEAPQVADGTINVDGILEDWSLRYFDDQNMIVLTKETAGHILKVIDDDKDFSAIIYAVYDADNLYVAAEVTDDIAVGIGDRNMWHNDRIQLSIDGAGDEGKMIGLDDFPLVNGIDADNYLLEMDINGGVDVSHNNDRDQIGRLIESVVKLDGANYTMEVRIPFKAIPELNIKTGMGFDVGFSDPDLPAQGNEGYILWYGRNIHDPTTWGDLLFAGPLAVKPTQSLMTTWAWIKRNNEGSAEILR